MGTEEEELVKEAELHRSECSVVGTKEKGERFLRN